MILNFCRHFFTSDKFFHILIPFLKKETEDPFFALGKNQKGKLFAQDCNTHSLVPFFFRHSAPSARIRFCLRQKIFLR